MLLIKEKDTTIVVKENALTVKHLDIKLNIFTIRRVNMEKDEQRCKDCLADICYNFMEQYATTLLGGSYELERRIYQIIESTNLQN